MLITEKDIVEELGNMSQEQLAKFCAERFRCCYKTRGLCRIDSCDGYDGKCGMYITDTHLESFYLLFQDFYDGNRKK